jgi:hypothetical protein
MKLLLHHHPSIVYSRHTCHPEQVLDMLRQSQQPLKSLARCRCAGPSLEGEPYNKIVRLAGQVVLDPRFTRWQPVLRVRCCFANFKNVIQVLQVLYISRIMPAEPLLPFDYSYHCIHPERALHCFESSILRCFDCRVPGIVTLERVTAGADAAFYFSKLRSCLTLPGWQAVR